MNDKDKYQLASEIVSIVVSKPNIEVNIAKNNREVGITDRKNGAYLSLHEFINYLTSHIK